MPSLAGLTESDLQVYLLPAVNCVDSESGKVSHSAFIDPRHLQPDEGRTADAEVANGIFPIFETYKGSRVDGIQNGSAKGDWVCIRGYV